MIRTLFGLALTLMTALVGAALTAGHLLPRADQLLYSSAQQWQAGNWFVSLAEVPRGITSHLFTSTTDTRPGLPVVWSPDGSRIAYIRMVNDYPQTWIGLAYGGAPISLGAGQTLSEYNAAWSPDGSRLAFIGERAAERQVYLAEPDGTNARQITMLEAGFKSLAWSPDGDSLVMETNSLEEQLYLLEINTGALRELTPPGGRNLRPAWSPDGSQLAFITNRVAERTAATAFDLYLMNPDGGDLRRLTFDHPARSSWFPWWSADGRYIALGSISWISNDDLYVVDVVSGEVILLTEPGADAAAPSWSPDGRYLAYETRYGGSLWRVALYDVTTAKTWLLPRTSGDQRRAAWSPDSAAVLYIGNEGRNWDIYQVGIAGENQPRRLTRNRLIDFSPVWRPAG
jgi:Tol biopolymer transport system component